MGKNLMIHTHTLMANEGYDMAVCRKLGEKPALRPSHIRQQSKALNRAPSAQQALRFKALGHLRGTRQWPARQGPHGEGWGVGHRHLSTD